MVQPFSAQTRAEFDDRIVVGSLDPDDLGAEAGDRRDPLVGDAGMDEDHGSRADERGALGDRAAVIAVSGAAEGHALGDGANRGASPFPNFY